MLSEERAKEPVGIDDPWFGPARDPARLVAAGATLIGGGAHQSKTMMLADLTALFATTSGQDAHEAIVDDNILGKPSLRARKVGLYRLDQLYGIQTVPPLCAAFAVLWRQDPPGRPLLALLCALMRDPSLRTAAPTVLNAAVGAQVRWPAFAAVYEDRYPARLGSKMLKSLSQNCASTFAQAGFLRGKLAKVRIRPAATPQAAAFAALIAETFGFGGPLLLACPWLAITDAPIESRISLLQAAASMGLLRIRVGGDIVEISVRERMASTLDIPALGHI